MSLITWNDNFRVNVREIDEQHKRWVEILNGLHPLRETVKKVNKVGVNPRGELHHASRTQEIYARTQSESCTVI